MKQITLEQGQQILAYCLLLGLTKTSEAYKDYYQSNVQPFLQEGWMGWIDGTSDEDFELIKDFVNKLVGEGVIFDREAAYPPSTLFINWAIQ